MDRPMRVVFPNGEDATSSLTEPQIIALERIAGKYDLADPIEVSPGFGGEYVLVDVGSMVLGIERDGYTHS